MEKESGRQPRRGLFSGIRQSLRAQIGLIMLLSYLIPVVLLGVFTGSFLMKKLENQTRSAVTSGAEQAWTLTNQNIERTLELARDATYDGELTDAWQKWNSESIGDAEFRRFCQIYLGRKYSREPLLSFVACFPVKDPKLKTYLRGGALEGSGKLQKLIETVQIMGEKLDTRCRFFRFENNIYLVRNLLNLRMERFGMLILGINEERLFQPLTELGREWDAEVAIRLDDCGDPEIDWKSAGTGLTDDRKEKLYYTRLSGGEENGLDLRLTMDRRKQYNEVYSFRMLLLVMALLLVPIMIMIGIYLSRRIVKPLTLLSAASRRIEEGKLGATVPLNGEDELGRLGRSFSQMSLRLKELIDKTYKEEIELKNAQILALQSRINPHFINNALEDINWQARIEGSESISSMVTSLSVLLNATMARQDRRLVTLREEMEVAEAYIYFIQQRFGTDLTVNREIDEKAMDGILPLLTIQPLLENAVEHGIAPAGGGIITIRCSLNDACMHVEIVNTGRETGKEDRERIEAALKGNPTGKHLGLANIVNRLRLIYGESVTIRVDTDTPGQTTVSIIIPREIH